MTETKLVPMKTVGKLTVYRREPKPVGVTTYVVGLEGGTMIKDFGRYAKALRWAKAQKEANQSMSNRITAPMNPRVAYNLRACVALDMHESGGFSFRDIRWILKLSGPDQARKLVARGQRLKEMPAGERRKLTGCMPKETT